MHLHLHQSNKKTRKPLLLAIKNARADKKQNEMNEKFKKLAAGVGAKFSAAAYNTPVRTLKPWMRRASYLMWNEAEDTYKAEKEKEKESNNINNNNILSPTAAGVGVQTIPEYEETDQTQSSETDGDGASYTMPTPKSHPHSIAAFSPPTNINSRAAKIADPYQMITKKATLSPQIPRRPKVRKSELLHRVISRRSQSLGNADEAHANGLLNRSRPSNNNISSLVYSHSDDNEKPPIYNMAEIKRQKTSETNTGYQSDNEMSDALSEDSDFDEELTLKPTATADEEKKSTAAEIEEISCGICGRSVPKNESHEADSRRDPNTKIRICEVCLYETDSEEDDTTADDSAFLDAAMNGSPAGMQPSVTAMTPTHSFRSIMDSDNDNNTSSEKIVELNKKTRQVTQSINWLINDMNGDDCDKKQNQNIKQQLLKLKADMEQLLMNE